MTSAVLFAGAGGSCTGIAQATGRDPALAVNHNALALASHALNHPRTRHVQEDVFRAQPWRVWPARRRLEILWASPSCTQHSRARGATPAEEQERSQALVVLDWVRQTAPRLVFLENVPEFEAWGPLLSDGRPDPARRGEHFQGFVAALRFCGYRVEWQTL